MPEVATVGPADYERVAAFLASFPGESRSAESWLARLRTWWDNNPAFTKDCPRGWMLCEAGAVVGFIGAIPLKFLAGGVETIAVGGTTWRVLVKYRGMSMTLKNRKMAAFPGAIHFATSAAPQVVAVLKLLRYQPLEIWKGGHAQSVIVLNMSKFLRDKFKSGALRAAMPVLVPMARFAQSLLLWRLRRCNTANVRELSKVDAAFDDLWARTRNVYLNTTVRTAEMIHWYCFAYLPAEKKLLGCFRGERLLGFMILSIEQDRGLRVAYCGDLWFDPSENKVEIVGALVSHAVKWSGRQGLDCVVFPHFHPRLAECYARLGLRRRPAWRLPEFIFGPSAFLDSMTTENSYLTGTQGEIGL